MKINLNFIGFIVISSFIVFLFGFTIQRNEARNLSKIVVSFEDETPPFITLEFG